MRGPGPMRGPPPRGGGPGFMPRTPQNFHPRPGIGQKFSINPFSVNIYFYMCHKNELNNDRIKFYVRNNFLIRTTLKNSGLTKSTLSLKNWS